MPDFFNRDRSGKAEWLERARSAHARSAAATKCWRWAARWCARRCPDMKKARWSEP